MPNEYKIRVVGLLLSKRPWSLKTEKGDEISGFSYAVFDPESKEIHMFSITNGKNREQIPDTKLASLDPDIICNLILKTSSNGKAKLNCESFEDYV